MNYWTILTRPPVENFLKKNVLYALRSMVYAIPFNPLPANILFARIVRVVVENALFAELLTIHLLPYLQLLFHYPLLKL
jgi:hypothetical protein